MLFNSLSVLMGSSGHREVVDLMVGSTRHMITNGAEALVMGCTEIPIILGGKDFSVPLIDPNEVIAIAAVQFARNQGSFS
jgi:aspartate/glutamate racemase